MKEGLAPCAVLTEMSPLNGFPVLDAGHPYLISLGVVVLMTYVGQKKKKNESASEIAPVQDKLSTEGETISYVSFSFVTSIVRKLSQRPCMNKEIVFLVC